jgi:hypothetical protein
MGFPYEENSMSLERKMRDATIYDQSWFISHEALALLHVK